MAENERDDEKPGPAKGEAYGMAAVTQALEGLDFPASKQDVIKKAKSGGHDEVSWTKDQKIRISELIQEAPEDNFESMAGVVHAVHEANEKKGS